VAKVRAIILLVVNKLNKCEHSLIHSRQSRDRFKLKIQQFYLSLTNVDEDINKWIQKLENQIQEKSAIH